MDNKLQLSDLLTDLKKTEQANISEFINHVNQGKHKKIEKLSRRKEQQIKRQENYNMTKEQLDKWLPMVKSNREKQSINFQVRDQTVVNTLNFFPLKPMNSLHQGIEKKLSSSNMGSSKQIIKMEQKQLQKVDPEQAKRRLIEAQKHRTAIFYEEQKRRRIAKIKSKLYRKIKKKQRLRGQAKKIEAMGASERQQYIQKMTRDRIKERITLRHKTKNRHMQNLLRFNKSQKNIIQQSINQVNLERKKRLEKVNGAMVDQISQEYDDQNFREEAIHDIQERLNAIQNQDNAENLDNQDNLGELSDMKFIQLAKQRRKNQQKRQAKKLLNKLTQNNEIDEEDLEENSNQEQEIDQMGDSQEQANGRKVFGKNIQQGTIKVSERKTKRIEDELNKHLVRVSNEQLIQGIDLDKLKQKYQPERVQIDLAQLIADNREIYEGTNQAALQNVREFQQQKLNQYEKQLEPEQKKLKGWGSWAGPGIQEKRIDPKEELKKKLKKIQELKKNRKDSGLANVTINENRNKTLSDYFVKNLPHNYANPDQFDYMQNEKVGSEWNSLNQFRDNIKPKIRTKVGQVINAAQLPKRIQKEGQNAGYNRN